MKLLAIILVLGVAPALSYNGFCFSQKRFLSDTEFIDAAIAEIIRLRTHNVIAGGGLKSVNVIRYENIAEFRRLNPDCCTIVRHNSEVKYVEFDDQVFGRAAKSVSLTYALNHLDEYEHRKSARSTAEVVIGNCGGVFNAGY